MELSDNKDSIETLVQNIETDILSLLKENTQLKEKISELSRTQISSNVNQKVIILEEELKKLKKVVDELQIQENNSRERIQQLYKIVQEVTITSSTKSNSNQENFGPKIKQSVLSKQPMVSETSEVQEINRVDEGEVGYSPFISTEEEFPMTQTDQKDQTTVSVDSNEPAGYDFFESDSTQKHNEVVEKEIPQYKEYAPDAPPELNIPKPLPETVLGKKGDETLNIPVADNPNAFLINEKDEEEDPFADTGEKLEDDDFFKTNN